MRNHRIYAKIISNSFNVMHVRLVSDVIGGRRCHEDVDVVLESHVVVVKVCVELRAVGRARVELAVDVVRDDAEDDETQEEQHPQDGARDVLICNNRQTCVKSWKPYRTNDQSVA